MPADLPTFALDAVLPRVAATRFADLRWVAETGSTNADLVRLAADGAAEGIVLGADHQTAGRGRQGRTWSAPADAAVLVSVLVRPPAAAVERVLPAVAVAAAEAVEVVTGVAPSVKWPNDLVAVHPVDGSERKLAGILAEATWPPGADPAGGWRSPPPSERVAVVVGMGLNVVAAGRDPALDSIAIACDELAPGRSPSREAIVAEWLVRLDHWYGRAVAESGRAELWAAWRARSATLGRRVRVDMGPDDLVGEAIDLDDEGRLVVRTDEGQVRVLAVGDVVHLRSLPADGSS